ncbi:MAG TPA: hypothetical protein VJ746_09780 [Nitrospira sp.]|nr:hypothetical protein [Nitrospira sp.]
MLVILGSGYTGQYVAATLSQAARPFVATSRAPERHLAYLPDHQRLGFDFALPRTWSAIPKDADLLWCFPAVPLDAVQQFAATIQGSCRRLIVLGSTSAYDVGEPDLSAAVAG